VRNTGIEWTDDTWNPIRGCSRVSAGCMNCYAETTAHRFSGEGLPYEGLTNDKGVWNGRVVVVEEHMNDPLHWMKPRRVFVNSMSDLFHEGLTFHTIARVFAVMHLAQRHTFQVLTKRPHRMAAWFEWMNTDEGRATWLRFIVGIPDGPAEGWSCAWPFRNIHLGVSAENQATLDERVSVLRRVPAAVRFVSAEPLLGPLDLERGGWALHRPITSPSGETLPGLDWIIVGGESGHGARPFRIEWARDIVDQCRAAGVAVFVKQLGSRCEWGLRGPFGFPLPVRVSREYRDGAPYDVVHLAHHKGADPDEWPADLRVREFPR
jgi:protein gp37